MVADGVAAELWEEAGVENIQRRVLWGWAGRRVKRGGFVALDVREDVSSGCDVEVWRGVLWGFVWGGERRWIGDGKEGMERIREGRDWK